MASSVVGRGKLKAPSEQKEPRCCVVCDRERRWLRTRLNYLRVLLQRLAREIAEGRADNAGAQPIVMRLLRLGAADRLDLARRPCQQLEFCRTFQEQRQHRRLLDRAAG